MAKNNGSWSKEDHDILIEIKTIVNALKVDFGTHIISIVSDFAKLDARMQTVENRNLKINAEERVIKYDTMYDEWNRHKERLNVQRGYLLAAATVLSIVFTAVVRYAFEHLLK
jgi:hypothetical protein